MNAYITDNLGQRYKLVQFFDHQEQKWLCALEFVPEEYAGQFAQEDNAKKQKPYNPRSTT